MHYGVALDALNDLVDDDTIVLGDIGSHNQWGRLVGETRNRNTLHCRKATGARWASVCPAAMAAKLAYPRQEGGRGDR